MDTFHQGELVGYQGHDCIVLDKNKHEHGYYLYTLWNVDNGDTYCTGKVNINKSKLETIDFEEEMEFEFVDNVENPVHVKAEPIASTSSNVNTSGTSTSRHSRLSSEDLDDISAANTEKATDKMTKWAVRVFKGIFSGY